MNVIFALKRHVAKIRDCVATYKILGTLSCLKAPQASHLRQDTFKGEPHTRISCFCVLSGQVEGTLYIVLEPAYILQVLLCR